MRRRVPLLLLLGLAGAVLAAPASADPQPVFHVGAAQATLDLPGETTGAPLQVRALYVSDGGTADVVVSVPVRGWLAGYRDGAGLGVTELRQEAAYELATAFHPPITPGLSGVLDGSGRVEEFAVTQGNVVVASTGCPTCPDLSGREVPVDRAVLRAVYEQTLAVVLASRRAARAATLEHAVADVGGAVAETVARPGADEGRPGDRQLTVLRAVDDRTGTTVGTVVSVPLGTAAGDHLGVTARELDARLGGTTVAVGATLADQVPLAEAADGVPLAGRLGALTASRVVAALAAARPVRDRDVAGAEVYQLVPGLDPLAAGERALVPPYVVGAAVGMWTTVLRFGEVALVSQPGQALPEVTRALRDALTGAQVVGVVGTAQDDLGALGGPDPLGTAAGQRSAAGPSAAQQSVAAAVVAAGQVGWSASAGVVAPVGADPVRYAAPAVQAVVLPRGASERSGPLRLPVLLAWSAGRLALPGTGVLPRLVVDGAAVEVVPGARPGTGWAVVEGAGQHRLEAVLPGTGAAWRGCADVVDQATVRDCA